MNNKMIRLFLAMAFVFSLAPVFGQNSLVLAPLQNDGNITEGQIRSLTRLFENALQRTKRFDIIDRGAVEDILKEHGFQLSDLSDSRKTAELGKLLNANFLVRPSVMALAGDFFLESRIVDVNTARMLNSAEVRIKTDLSDAYEKLAEFVAELTDTSTANAAIITNTTVVPQCKVEYSVHASGIGWMGMVSDGDQAGTTGQGRQIEAIRIKVTSNIPGNIQYTVHASSIGWLSWVSDNAQAGTTGQNRRIEAIRVRLTDDLSQKFSVQYRVYMANIGWSSWVSNSETAGTTGQSRRVEAIQIRMAEKK